MFLSILSYIPTMCQCSSLHVCRSSGVSWKRGNAFEIGQPSPVTSLPYPQFDVILMDKKCAFLSKTRTFLSDPKLLKRSVYILFFKCQDTCYRSFLSVQQPLRGMKLYGLVLDHTHPGMPPYFNGTCHLGYTGQGPHHYPW